MSRKSTSSAVTTAAASPAAIDLGAIAVGAPPFSSVTSLSKSCTCLERSADCASRPFTTRSWCRLSAACALDSVSMRLNSTVESSSRRRISA